MKSDNIQLRDGSSAGSIVPHQFKNGDHSDQIPLATDAHNPAPKVAAASRRLGLFLTKRARHLTLVLYCLAVMPTHPAAANTSEQPPDVLFIALDDLNDWIGCLDGHPLAKTPRIDALATSGVLFTNAHCQAPLCNPSRASVMSGLRPSTTGLYTLRPGVRDVPRLQNHVMLPQYFAQNGYRTFSAGKVYHDRSVNKDEPNPEFQEWGDPGALTLPKKKLVETPSRMREVDWGVFPENDEDQPDWKIADSAINWINSVPADEPFFLAVGFRLPHFPCFATQRWFDLYPDKDAVLPPYRNKDRDDIPPFAWYLHWDLPEPRLSWLREAGEWESLARAYLASNSFVDSQIGRVLDALNESGRAENTVIVLWSDHGWHLGEKDITGKNTLWERSTRVPLIFAGPGVKAGTSIRQPVELLDIYPTLVELCGLPPQKGLEGQSLAAAAREGRSEDRSPAITTVNRDSHAIRSERWRYICYGDGSEELYDMENDPNEWTNLANKSQFKDIISDHAKWIPKTPEAHTSGSARRILIKDGEKWLWENKPITGKPPGIKAK